MSNTVRNGFSTLNRLLGKKNKNPLSKSTTNINKLSTVLDTTSQHNQIFPLAASTNAPFEQTFRITISLPLGQLFVVRVGAKTKLSTLLEMVCSNKLLEKDKFVFTHPTNVDQIFDLSLTIGEVGLNEIRLAHKTARRNIDEQPVKYRLQPQENRYVNRPQSMFVNKSSPSPYSSTTSLNSTDSSGINSSLRSSNGSHLPVVPTRKKRIAPRPPSQNSIPEDAEQRRGSNDGRKQDDDAIFKRPLDRKDFHVSSPNLSPGGHLNGGMKYKDFHVSNGNIYTINEPSGDNSLSGSDITNSSDGGIGKSTASGRPMSMMCDLRYNAGDRYGCNGLNGNGYGSYIDDGNRSRTPSEASESIKDGGFPEPIPRKKVVVVAKKKAPAPPPRTTSVNIPTPPVATPRSSTPRNDENAPVIQIKNDRPQQQKQPPSVMKSKSTPNITKVMLNVQNLQINIPDESVADRPVIKESTPDVTPTGDNVFSHQITQKVSTDSKLTDNERTAAIDHDVSRKNTKNLNKGVRFEGNDTAAIDHNELSQEINEIVDQAVEINANNQTELTTNDYEDQCMRDELCKEITNIINTAVEINVKSDEETASYSGNSSPTDHTINENDVVKASPGSPEWNYPLPGSNHFAVSKTMIGSELSSEENYDGRGEHALFTSSPYPKYNECPILPIIKQKEHVDFHECSDNSSTTTATTDTINSSSASGEQENIITSDIEDGYLGNDVKSKQHRELLTQQQQQPDVDSKRDQFIESEFGFLSEHDDPNDEELEAEGKDVKETELVNENYSSRDCTEAIMRDDNQTVIRQKSTESNGSTASKTDVIGELNDIINTKRLDTVIKKCEENDDIDAAKRSSLINFQIRPYTKSMSENHTKVNGDVGRVNGIERSNSLVGDHADVFGKPREFTPVKRSSLTLPHGARHINRSDSFHSTHIMQQNHLQPHFQAEYAETMSLTPRSSSYISLIGIQRYENRAAGKAAFGNGINETTRRKSSSELSIADSPSLQSLQVMKSILSNSRKNSLNNGDHDVSLKAAPVTNVEEAEEPKEVKPIAAKTTNHEPKDAEQEEQPSTPSVSKIKSAFESKTDEPKKWTYQGPPAVSLSTWGERPKSQVQIKSDNDYKFGGIISKKQTLLQNRFSTAAIHDSGDEHKQQKELLNKRLSTPNPSIVNAKNANGAVSKPMTAPKPAAKPAITSHTGDEVDSSREPPIHITKEYERRVTPLPVSECKQELGTLPIVCGVEYKKNINLDDEFIKNDPIMRATAADEERTVQRSRSSYEVSRIVNERPFSLVADGPASMGFDSVASTMTLGRVPVPNKFVAHRQTMNFAPLPYHRNSTSHPIQRNSSFSSALMARMSLPSSDEKPPGQFSLKSPSPVAVKIGTYESEKPAFAQFTLRRTGLKEKIIDDNRNDGPAKNVVASPVSPPPAPIFPKPNAIQATAEPKRNSACTPDPRNQLLDSIRNFSRNELRKA